jgi:hypothetical protein
MGLFKRLFHRHTWRPLRTEYRYTIHNTGQRITVKRCQCRDCGKIGYIHFAGKEIVY